MRRLLLIVPLLAVAMVTLAGPLSPADEAAAEETTLTVLAGDGEQGYSVNAFLPSSVTINEGDTVNWQFPWYEIHMVVIINGPIPDEEPAPHDSGVVFDGTQDFIFSGILAGPDAEFDVQFTKPGSYPYTCFIHPGMDGTVTVLGSDSDSGEVDNQRSLDARAKADYDSSIIQLKNIAAGLTAAPVAVTRRADGTSQYVVNVDAPVAVRDDIQQFFPATANIKVGDSIIWKNPNTTPHTITFGTPPPGDPFEAPASKSGGSYDGTGFWNSGILWMDPATPNAPTNFETTFTKAGSFKYICLLHADQGMVGTVAVTAAAATTPTAPLPPNTGAGLAAGEDGSSNLFVAIAGIAIIVAGASVVAIARRGTV